MANLTVNDELMERLELLARDRGVSVQALAQELLNRQLDRRSHMAEVRRLLDEVAALTPAGVKQTDSVDLLREDRNR